MIKSHQEPITRQGLYFDTLISISIYDSDDAAILDDCFKLCEKYEQMLSAEIPASDIYILNNASARSVSINKETVSLINDSLYYSDITNGLFDISVYAVSSLWDFHSHDGEIPDSKDIANALNHVGYSKIKIDNSSTATLNDPDSKIELGGIAKGYIADMIAMQLQKSNVTSAIINIGGDIHVIGHKPDNRPFTIGIKDPDSAEEVMAAIGADNICVATSGTYERYIEHDGQRYHHILNPHTGYPVESDVSSVTVITDSSERADALCTCVILCGSNNGLALIEEQKNTEAIMKLTDGRIIKSSGINKFIISSQ